MDDLNFKTCVVCSTEKRVDDFYNKYRESKQCNNKRVLERYYNKKHDVLQKRRDKCARFKEMDSRSKALEKRILNR